LDLHKPGRLANSVVRQVLFPIYS